MPFKRKVNLPIMDLAGKKGRQALPRGVKYSECQFRVFDTAGQAADAIIDKIRFVVNGVDQRTVTMAELEAKMALMGTRFKRIAAGTAAVGNLGYEEIVYFPFAQLFRKDVAFQEFLALATAGVSDVAIEFDLLLDVAAAGVSIIGSAKVWNSLVQITQDGKPTMVQEPMGFIEKWYRKNVKTNGYDFEITDLPLNRGDYSEIILFDSYITNVIIKLNDVIVHEFTKQVNDADLARNEIVPAATNYAIEFDVDDVINNLLPMSNFNGVPVTRFEIFVTSSDATPRNIPVVYSILGNPD
jgi:hypothetical protein